jgi:hypothetical protein
MDTNNNQWIILVVLGIATGGDSRSATRPHPHGLGFFTTLHIQLTIVIDS